jgi:hypothetical protein
MALHCRRAIVAVGHEAALRQLSTN